MNYPKVSIILLNCNGWRDTIECLESLYKITYPNYDVIVVDNGSEDDSIEKIKKWAEDKIKIESRFFKYNLKGKPIRYVEYTREEVEAGGGKEGEAANLPSNKLIIIKNEKNYGFSEGNNIAIRYALKKGTDYALLLNNDTVVDSEFLTELVKVAENDPQIGIVGPKIYNYDEINKIVFAGRKINFWRGKSYNIGINETDNGQHDKIKEVDYIEGSCFLIKKEAIEKVGMIDSEYFVYWGDTDWCIRAHKVGLKVVYVPEAEIWHKESSTMGGPLKVYYFNRNRFLFMKKHATQMQIFSFLISFFIIELWFRIGVFLLYYKNPKVLIPFFRGIKDGISLISKKER